MYVCVCVCVCIVGMCVCMHACMYICMYAHGVFASSEEWSLLQVIVIVSSLPICLQCQTWRMFAKIILLEHI